MLLWCGFQVDEADLPSHWWTASLGRTGGAAKDMITGQIYSTQDLVSRRHRWEHSDGVSNSETEINWGGRRM